MDTKSLPPLEEVALHNFIFSLRQRSCWNWSGISSLYLSGHSLKQFFHVVRNHSFPNLRRLRLEGSPSSNISWLGNSTIFFADLPNLVDLSLYAVSEKLNIPLILSQKHRQKQSLESLELHHLIDPDGTLKVPFDDLAMYSTTIQKFCTSLRTLSLDIRPMFCGKEDDKEAIIMWVSSGDDITR